MAHEQLGLFAGQVESRAVGSFFELHCRGDAEGGDDRFRKSTMGAVGIVLALKLRVLARGRIGLAAADLFHAPLGRRSAGCGGTELRGPIM
jgi:hypothetical protein